MLDPCPQISVAFLISEIPTSNGPLATPRINICSVIYQQSSRDITASWPREWAVHHHKFPGSLGRGRGLNRQVTTGGSTQMGNCTLPPTDPTWVLGHNYGLGVFHSETWELRSERHVGPGKTVCKLRLGSEENLLRLQLICPVLESRLDQELNAEIRAHSREEFVHSPQKVRRRTQEEFIASLPVFLIVPRYR